jgi:hypothetical protein
MKTQLIFSLIVSSLITVKAIANDSKYLINEMENVRNSLSLDDPKRGELTLRLADLYFDVSIQEGKAEGKKISEDQEQDFLQSSRKKALELYTYSLDEKVAKNKPTGENRLKVLFQMARLHTRLGEGKNAENLYKEILADSLVTKKMKEQSALALAEFYEEDAQMSLSRSYYNQSAELCKDVETCNYIYYRLGWLLYKDTKLDEAIVAMEKSLWLNENTIRENSLTDLILFMSNKESDGKVEFDKIEKIAKKANRPELKRQLVEAFYVAGNRLAGSNLLAELNKDDPNLYYEVRLLEEFYGFRKWDKVEQYLKSIGSKSSKDMPAKAEERKEIETTLRRFIVQVDSEMQVVKSLNVFLKQSIEIYLDFFPHDDQRKKMQAGWLSAVDDRKEKISMLGTWIKEDLKNGVDSLEVRKLRQTRLSLAQELKQNDIVLEEALAISKLLENSPEKDEFTYVAAREFYEQKKYNEAMPLFSNILTRAQSTQDVGQWAILSQNLILDIYNSQKNYDGIISQIAFWKKLPGVVSLKQEKELKEETLSMDKILLEAKFEKAVALKDTKEALEQFYEFCKSGQYVEKSCINAKVLSVKFKDQAKLVSVLELLKDESSLIVEYELMGRFKDAAKLLEKNQKSPTFESAIKIAFLYELELDYGSRNRVLESLTAHLSREKSLNKDQEKILFSALVEAGLINDKTLSLPWSTSYKLKVASQLESIKPNATAQKLLLSQKEGHGPIWSRLILAKAEDSFQKVNKVKFYGSQSKSLFTKRTKAIETFANEYKPILDGADLETRIYLLHMLKMTYKNMANEILNTPIPEGLDDETLANVTTQISTMADPFDRVNEDYDRLLTEQVNQITEADLKAKVTTNLNGNGQKIVQGYAQFISQPENKRNTASVSTMTDVQLSEVKTMISKLSVDPEDKVAMSQLIDIYTKNNNSRAAQYFVGRLENLKQVE